MENLALQDMLMVRLCVVDPHGDVVDGCWPWCQERTEDVIYFSPAEMDYRSP